MKMIGFRSLQEPVAACSMDLVALWRYFNGDVRPLVNRLPLLFRGLQISLDELLVALNVYI